MDRETEFGRKVGGSVQGRFRMGTAPIVFGIETNQCFLLRCRQKEILARKVERLFQWLYGSSFLLMDVATSFCQDILAGICQEQGEHSFPYSLQVDDAALLGAYVQCFQAEVLMEAVKVQTIGREVRNECLIGHPACVSHHLQCGSSGGSRQGECVHSSIQTGMQLHPFPLLGDVLHLLESRRSGLSVSQCILSGYNAVRNTQRESPIIRQLEYHPLGLALHQCPAFGIEMAMHRCGIPFGLHGLLPYLQGDYGESLGTEILHQLGVCTQIVDVRFPDGACLQPCHELPLFVAPELFPEQHRVLSVENLHIQILAEGGLHTIGGYYLSHYGDGIARPIFASRRSDKDSLRTVVGRFSHDGYTQQNKDVI